MKFHHFGLLSSDPEASRQLLIDLGYEVLGPIEDPLQSVQAWWASHETMPAIEIISPIEIPGTVNKLRKSLKQGVYHLCFEVTDLQTSLACLGARNRLLEVSSPKPAVLFQNRQVSFHFVENLGLVELLETADPGKIPPCSKFE